MTNEEFIKKYYSVPAASMKDESWEECIKHSIRKHYGQRHNINHGFTGMGVEISYPANFMKGSTCAMCHKASTQRIHRQNPDDDCSLCPLTTYSIECGKSDGLDYEGPEDPWSQSMDLEKTYPLLRALIHTLREVRKHPEVWK